MLSEGVVNGLGLKRRPHHVEWRPMDDGQQPSTMRTGRAGIALMQILPTVVAPLHTVLPGSLVCAQKNRVVDSHDQAGVS
jgi:hypothetical protein